MNYLEVHEILTYYYRSPVPEQASEVIRWFTATSLVEDPLSCAPTAYFFARMAQDHPGLIREYEDLVRETRPEGKNFLLAILKDLKSTPPGPINILHRSVRTGSDNDLLWAEFFLTGSSQPILRLIELLERPDIVRKKLQAWLTSPFRFFRTDERCRRTWEKLRATAGIAYDYRLRGIETRGDLDCLCLMQGLDLTTSDRFDEIRRALPFKLNDMDLNQMGIKATAKWSLASNVNRHPRVLATCEEELARRKGNIKKALQEIVEKAHLNREDYARAMKLRQAADRGNAEAQCKLGIMYEDGKGVHKDYTLAAIWYRKAAEQGVAEAQYRLGSLYDIGIPCYDGEGVQKDDMKSEKWYRKAAEQGVAEAQFRLGDMYFDGDGVQQDYTESEKWYREAAEQGLAEAQCGLGVMFYEGPRQNSIEAVKWYRKAAEQGLVVGQYLLGDMYYRGDGVRQDYTEAAKWLRKAAEQGDAAAQEDLANMYAEGLAVPKAEAKER